MGPHDRGATRVSAAGAALASNTLFKTMTACSSSLFNDPFAPATSIPVVKIKRFKTIVRFVQAFKRCLLILEMEQMWAARMEKLASQCQDVSGPVHGQR